MASGGRELTVQESIAPRGGDPTLVKLDILSDETFRIRSR